MKLQLEVDTANVAEIKQALAVLRGLLAAHGLGEGDTPTSIAARTDSPDRAIADLWNRLGENGQQLVALAATFDGPFSLATLAARTGDTPTAMKSRWANLGRSLRKTLDQFSVRVFKEHENTADGWTFVMDEGAKAAVRELSKRTTTTDNR